MDDPMPDMPASGRTDRLLKAALVFLLATAVYVQLDAGLADQGDFMRAANWFTSGAVGLDEPSPSGTPQYKQRYFNYYLPYWQSRPGGIGNALADLCNRRPSTCLLWLPGVAVNHLLYSDSVLYVPVVTLLPRLLLIGCLFALFVWIDASTERLKPVVYLLLGVPLILLLSTTDYLAYLNSFYQETGTMVYLGLWIASLLYVKRRPESLGRGVLCFGALMLLVCAKSSNVYWVVAGLPFLVLLRHPWEWSKRRAIRLAAIFAALSLALLAIYAVSVGHSGQAKQHAYHGLFCGILVFSEDPPARLAELGFDDAAACVRVSSFEPRGVDFVARHRNRMSYLNVLRVAWAEPLAMARMLKCAADNMHDLSLDDLGKRAAFDPQTRPIPTPACNVAEQRWWDPASTTPLNLWSFVKFHCFPTGWAFLAAVAVCAAVFAALLRKDGLLGDLALVGLIAALACPIDMCVAICGDGTCGLIKHLFLANLLFDVAAVALLGVAGLAAIRRWCR